MDTTTTTEKTVSYDDHEIDQTTGQPKAQQAPEAAPPPPAAPAPAPAPAGAVPAPAPDWVQLPGGGWAPPGHPAAQMAQAGGPATTTPIPGNPQTIQDVYRQQLMGLLQGPTPEAAAAAAGTSPQVAAFRTAQQRSFDRSRAQLAEQNAQQGLTGSGAAQTQVMGLEQARGENEASFEAQVAQKAMDDRRQQLMQAIQMAQQAGQFDQAQALERELKMSELSIQQQSNAADLALREKLGLGQLDLSKLSLDQQKQLAQMEDAYKRAALSQEGDLTRSAQAIQSAGQSIQQQLGLGDLQLREKLGLGDLDLRKYGIDVGAGTAADQLGFNYAQLQENANEAAAKYLTGAV